MSYAERYPYYNEPKPIYFGGLLFRCLMVRIDLEYATPPTFGHRTSENAYMGVLQDADETVMTFYGETPDSVRDQAEQWAATQVEIVPVAKISQLALDSLIDGTSRRSAKVDLGEGGPRFYWTELTEPADTPVVVDH